MRIASSISAIAFVWLGLAATTKAQSVLPASTKAAAQRVAGPYPLSSAHRFGRDSIVLVFRDSKLTADALHANTWMFGPPTTKAEEDGCPREKVLGRRIARAVWTELGRPTLRERIVVRVSN